MAVLAATSLAGPQPLYSNTKLTLGSSDTFVFDPTVTNCLLILDNTTAGALTLTITGSAPSSAIAVPGYGMVSAASGYSTGSIAAGTTKTIRLDNIREYLAGSGTVTMSGASGLVATFLKWA